jgi:2-polyprenyl-3-methyl-5-hydroxy-6-metoxy-1,4-benzoquinol methylase
MAKYQTAERVSHIEKSDNYIYQRSLLAYIESKKVVFGNLLEIGTGSGYGIEYLSSKVDKFVTIDKYENPQMSELLKQYTNIEFYKQNVPPLKDIASEYFDFVISFQVIEHIKNDKEFVKEIHRVLKKGGKFIVSTPNIKMSLTRNPWHIREYTIEELNNLLSIHFRDVEKLGVFGNEKAMEYYAKNKESVKKYTRFDILNLQYILPRKILQLPYDILNRKNRKKLLSANVSLVSEINKDDFHIKQVDDNAYDLFFIATKN